MIDSHVLLLAKVQQVLLRLAADQQPRLVRDQELLARRVILDTSSLSDLPALSELTDLLA